LMPIFLFFVRFSNFFWKANFVMRSWPGLPDSSWHKIPKWGYFNELPKKLPNSDEIKQMATKYTKWQWKISKFCAQRASKM
jgi:hypothetical protein